VTDATVKRVGLLVFDGVEVLDFCGPYEVFAITRLDEARRYETASPLELKLISPAPELVTCTGGLRFVPDCALADIPELDVLVVPGGRGVLRELGNRGLPEWIAAQYPAVEILASVCTGAFLLAAAGLLDGRRATTHWRWLDRLREGFPSIEVVEGTRVVEAGKIMTAGGVTAGIDLALAIVARLWGTEVAKATARQLEYAWRASSGS
jgi:transcriptional regulator GlxA family with amidase domain